MLSSAWPPKLCAYRPVMIQKISCSCWCLWQVQQSCTAWHIDINMFWISFPLFSIQMVELYSNKYGVILTLACISTTWLHLCRNSSGPYHQMVFFFLRQKWLIFLAFKSELCCFPSVLLSARALCCWRGLLCGLRMGFGRISQAWPDLTFVRGLWYKTVAGWAYKTTPGRLLVHFDL